MISIPNPCPKKWNEMSPVNGGNYCNACEKVVVDMTQCSNDEILEILNAKGRVCGRLSIKQVQLGKQNRFSKYLAAFLVIISFGFYSCGDNEQEHAVGDVVNTNDSVIQQNSSDSATVANTIKPEAPFKLSPADSTKVADSVEHNKNHVRDFE